MLHPPTVEWGEGEEGEGDRTGESFGRAVRYTINIETGEVSTATFPNTINNRHIDKFGRDKIIIIIITLLNITSDFPTINENYRGKKYCYTYGVSSFSVSRHALVKKNLCNSEEDKVRLTKERILSTLITKVLYRENHYMSEMQFLPRPGELMWFE